MPAELDWMHFQPHHSRSVDQTQGTDGKVDAGASAAVFQVRVPEHSILRISAIGFGSMSPSALVHASFRISRDNDTMGDYYNVPCAIGSLARPGAVVAFAQGPCTVRVEVTNGYPLSAFRYYARVVGWLLEKVR
jgi:hypothetical protein